jgi:hypothetical protein
MPFSDASPDKNQKAMRKISKEDFDNENDLAYEADRN